MDRETGRWRDRVNIGRPRRQEIRAIELDGPMTQRITVHDPRGYPPKVVGKRLAPRLPSLDGKTIYLVDCLFDNSAVFMDQLRDWFGEHLPAVDARIIRPKETWADDPEMRTRIAADGDAAILGIGL
jgi:hypothetical protein